MFVRTDGLKVDINLKQSGILDTALSNSIVAANRNVEILAEIHGSDFVKNASNSYTWHLDGHTLGPFSSPELNYTFAKNKSYALNLVIISNITLPNSSNITKLGNKDQTIFVKNEIKEMNVSGNTWLLDGALLRLTVNCTGGDPPFRYCYNFFHTKQKNYSCVPQIYENNCYFPITHYFPKNGTYFIEIMIFNDLNFKHKTISVKVYDSEY